MPSPTRWMLHISFVCLLLGSVLGTLLLIDKALSIHPFIWQLLPVHYELLTIGWIVQFTLGTAYWILPRFLKGEARGSETQAFFMVAFLNFGILFVLLGHFFETAVSLVLIGRILQLAAVLTFIKLHWKRILTYRSAH